MTDKEKTVEQRVAETILQKKVTVSVGGREFEVARPSIATLYDFSAIVSGLDNLEVEKSDNMQDIIADTIRSAKYAPIHAEALAKLILGAREKGYIEEVRTTETVTETPLFGLRSVEKTVEKVEQFDRFEELKSFIFYNGTPQENMTAMVKILGTNSEAAFFLNTTIFLKGTKLTTPTKTTALG